MTDGFSCDVCSFFVFGLFFFHQLYFDIGKPHQTFFHIVKDVVHNRMGSHGVKLTFCIGRMFNESTCIKCCQWNMMFFTNLSLKNIFFRHWIRMRRTRTRTNNLYSEVVVLASRVFFFVAGKYKWIFCRKFLETQEKSAQSMMWMKNQSSKMFVLKFQLIVAFCLINGRFAYREYVADDASDYVHGSSSNISHFNSNEPPGKKIFQNFIFIQNMPIFLHKI